MHESSTKRIAYLAAVHAGFFIQLQGRGGKPFNPMLGETYEFISTDFRFMAETVSHHPPTFALSMEGQNFTSTAISSSFIKFNGKSVHVTQNYPTKIFL